MDTPLGEAMEMCSDKRIRHLLIVDDQKQLVGLVTDRDLRCLISPRVGTISENNSDRESLRRPVHLAMVHEPVVASPEKSLSEAAELMLANRVGCLPVVDEELHVIGIVTTTDLMRYIAQSHL
jgi:acetoin utilization protein AcuB